MKPCFFCNQSGHRPPPGLSPTPYPYPALHQPQYPGQSMYPGYSQSSYPSYPGQCTAPPAYPMYQPPQSVVFCIHCDSKGYKQFAGRLDPCFFCNKNASRPYNPNVIHCIHCKSTGYQS